MDDRAAAEARIAQIDDMFENANGWGSWMVEAANEREALATRFGICRSLGRLLRRLIARLKVLGVPRGRRGVGYPPPDPGTS